MLREIGNIYNHYGGLAIKQDGDKFFWSIEDYNGHNWEEIPKYVFDTLTKYQDTLERSG